MSAVLGWWFALCMVGALCADVAIVRDSWKRGWIALAAFGSFAAMCAVVGIAFLAIAVVGGAS
jgi:hypothetical protein